MVTVGTSIFLILLWTGFLSSKGPLSTKILGSINIVLDIILEKKHCF